MGSVSATTPSTGSAGGRTASSDDHRLDHPASRLRRDCCPRPGGQEGAVEFVLDTGFTGLLTLPPTACAALGLPLLGYQPARLADNSQVFLDIYQAAILWDEVERPVDVLAMNGAPLIGMVLLSDHEVVLRVTDGGSVTIEMLQRG